VQCANRSTLGTTVYPPFQTCHRRFQQWVRSGKLEKALQRLARHLHERGQLNLDEAFVEATFASAKKGALPWAHPARQGHEDHRYRRFTGSEWHRTQKTPFLTTAGELVGFKMNSLAWSQPASNSPPMR
jgi:hypothetical protein